MKQLPSDKYNIAWFKLADFVSRGEKERALGIYRLLIHSFNDKALAAQLEGDLLLAFNDVGAHKCYQNASELYKADGRIMQAIALMAHLITLEPQNYEYKKNVFRLYLSIEQSSRCIEYLDVIMKEDLQRNQYNQCLLFIEESLSIKENMRLIFYQKIVLFCINHKDIASYTIAYLKKTLRLLQQSKNIQELNHFLTILENSDQYYYDQAYHYLLEDHNEQS